MILTFVFAVLSITDMVADTISVPLMFFFLAIVELLLAVESFQKRKKGLGFLLLMIAFILLAVAVYIVILKGFPLFL